MNVTLYTNQQNNGNPVEFDTFNFPGGERHIRFSFKQQTASAVKILANLQNADDIMQLLLAVDAIRRQYGQDIEVHLTIPYFPYARQDRVCVEGEACGAEVMVGLVNNLNCQTVTVIDAHSEVILNKLNNVTHVTQTELITNSQAICQKLRDKQLTLVSPDKGARLKTRELALKVGQTQIIEAEKVRDAKTGLIEHVDINTDVSGKNLLIVDDICDGGRTFIELAKQLKKNGAKSVSLYVTHGIFSKGLAVFKGLIDTIYTTDTFNSQVDPVAGVDFKVIKVCEQF